MNNLGTFTPVIVILVAIIMMAILDYLTSGEARWIKESVSSAEKDGWIQITWTFRALCWNSDNPQGSKGYWFTEYSNIHLPIESLYVETSYNMYSRVSVSRWIHPDAFQEFQKKYFPTKQGDYVVKLSESAFSNEGACCRKMQPSVSVEIAIPPNTNK
jgi:hypothetical protein